MYRCDVDIYILENAIRDGFKAAAAQVQLRFLVAAGPAAKRQRTE